MNSFKKIAVITAAALSLVGLAVPAQAAPLAVNVGLVANATTALSPATVPVPALNVINAASTVAISATADSGTNVTFSASPTVKLVAALNTVDAPKTVTSGVSAYAGTSNGSAMVVYAYTTSTAVGFVTVVNGAYSTVVYLKGIAGTASNVSVSVPLGTAVGTVPTIAVSTTDVFGNPVGGEPVSVTVLGSTLTGGSITGTVVTSSVTDPLTGAVLGTGKTTLATAVSGEITVVANGVAVAPVVTGLPAPVRAAIAKFSVADYAAELEKAKKELENEKAEHAKTKKELEDVKKSLEASKKDKEDTVKSKDEALAKALADAKTLSDKAIADLLLAKAAEINALKSENTKVVSALKKSFNDLAKRWNRYHSVKVALIK
jgi:hypothetical protein